MNDLEFVQRCVKSDTDAWNEFARRYSRLIYSCIYHILKTKTTSFINLDTVKDIFQDVLFSLVRDDYRKLKSFKAKNGCSLASWLRQVTINLTIDYLRKLKPTVSLDEDNPEGISLKDILADEEVSCANEIVFREKLDYLKDCIEELEAEEKYFLEMYLNQGLSLEEMSKVLRISRSALDMRKARIIRRLRECFKHRGFALDF
ncbi:MAG: RNA polymerase sigma factor [Candidatus Omnitrophica bacterium]|nr:RNA polymerase sigma factor [Candidatus Omnitrophota bacterium]